MIVQDNFVCAPPASFAKAVLDVAGRINASRASVRVDRPLPVGRPIGSILRLEGHKGRPLTRHLSATNDEGRASLRSPERRSGAGKKTTIRNIVKNIVKNLCSLSDRTILAFLLRCRRRSLTACWVLPACAQRASDCSIALPAKYCLS
jgi:hypothetical protein